MANPAITAISMTSNIVSVTTASAHGIAVNQAVNIQGVTVSSYNGIYVAATVPSSTTLTYNLVGVLSASSGGTTSPVKELIVLNTQASSGGEQVIQCAFWYPTVPGGELPGAGASAFSRATAAENAALLQGILREEVINHLFPSTYTPTQIQTFLLALYATRLSYLQSQNMPGQFYGFYYDGAAWNRA